MEYLYALSESITDNYQKNSFFIKNSFYSYKDLAICISKIRNIIAINIPSAEKLVGLVTNDDLETYASIIALWFEGKAYVPINPQAPLDRNEQVLKSTESNFVIDSSETSLYSNFNIINSKKLSEPHNINLKVDPKTTNDQLAYILFTSGSTGVPKGVPITYNNLNGFVTAINSDPEFQLECSDKCLQMFELTFDMSVVSYLMPLLAGACIYTIPENTIKYFYIYKLIKEQELTVLTLVPSIINYLRPYFPEINAKNVRYCSFAGGALHEDIVSEWSDCIPKSKIFNYYGPSETTIYSGYYPYKKEVNTKSFNGIISIGTPMGDLKYLIVDENNKEVTPGINGELCISGSQVTPGYWKNKERNDKVFFTNKKDQLSYYKTGDLCFKDNEGDYLFVGRADFQVKIRGFRVELAEIEFHAKASSPKKVAIVALDIINKLGNAELALAIESDEFDTEEMIDYMKTKMPDYMIPGHIQFIKEFPHNLNGKIDRNKLKSHFNLN